MKNVLFVTTYSGMGGGETLTLNLMSAMDRSRYALHLITPAPGLFPQKAAEIGVKVHHVPYRGTSTFFVPRLWALLPITRALRAFLIAHNIEAVISDYHTLPFVVPAAESIPIPVIWNAMGWWFPIYPWQRPFFESRVSRILAITQAVKDKLIGEPPRLDPDRIEVIIPGVDIDYFKPGVDGSAVRQRLGIGADVPLVGMAARFQVHKGHETFLEAARQVAAVIPEARFVVSGDNTGSFKIPKDEAYKQFILDTARTDPILRSHVTYLGFYPDVREVIAASDVMVCSSNFESLLMVALESMSMGRPIVSTAVGGPSETVIEGVTGNLVPPRNGKALADKIVALLRDPEKRRAMGEAGRSHVVEHFSSARYAARIGSILDEANGSAPHPQG